MKDTVWLFWSGGKDSAWSLAELRRRGLSVAGLVSTVSGDPPRVGLHGIAADLLKQQAAAVGLPLYLFETPGFPSSNRQYEALFRQVLELAERSSVTSLAWGDLHLEDVRAYREGLLEGSGLTGRFPLWGRDTRALAREMVDGGLEAVVTCVDTQHIPASLLGAAFDGSFLAALPREVDPCGENGEFHTLVTGGPGFSGSLAWLPGERERMGSFETLQTGCASD